MSATTIPMSALPLFPSGHKITDSPTEFIRGIREICALVGATMGPFGTNVIPTGHMLQSAVWRDGLRVIEGYTPSNPIGANAVLRIRDAAVATHRKAGDGTSTTTMFLSTLYLTAMEMIMRAEKDQPAQPVVRRLVAEKITAYLDRMIEALDGMAVKDISYEILVDVATLAGANNRELGEKIAGLIYQIGPKGTVNIEYTKSGILETAVIPGYAFEGGLYDPSMLPPSSAELKLENPYIILLYDQLLTEIEVGNLVGDWVKKEFEPNLVPDQVGQRFYVKAGVRPLVIISPDIDAQALSMLVQRQNVHPTYGLTGVQMPIYLVRPPKGIPLEEFYQDLQALVGGKVLNRKTGSRFEKFVRGEAGQATRLIASMFRTTIVGDSEKGSALEARIQSEMAAMDDEAKLVAQERLARLRAKVGTIRVPGPTQGTLAWGLEVVDDSKRAAQSALEHGVLPGCGRALISAFGVAFINQGATFGSQVEDRIAHAAVLAASESILRTVLANAGVTSAVSDLYVGRFDELLAGLPIPADTVLVNETLVREVRYYQDGNDLTRLFDFTTGNAFESGVLDSALGVIEAVKNSKAEIALWIQTKHWSLT